MDITSMNKLHVACCATSPDDLNWIPWLAIAHADPAKVDGGTINKIYQDFKLLWPQKFDDNHPDWDDDYEWLDDDDGNGQWKEFNDYLDGLGYTTFHTGSLVWLCE